MATPNPSLSKRSSFFANYRDARSLRSHNSSKSRRHTLLGPSSGLSKYAGASSTGSSPKETSSGASPVLGQSATHGVGSPLFGASLQTAYHLSAATSVISCCFGNEDHPVLLTVPSIIAHSISFLKKNHCFDKEGVFRVGGSLKRIKKLQQTFNEEPSFDYSDNTQVNIKELTVYDVATLLKRYLNALPDSIIPPDVFKDIKQELESVQYRDLLIYSQSASETSSLRIVDDQPNEPLETQKLSHSKNEDDASSDATVFKTPALDSLAPANLTDDDDDDDDDILNRSKSILMVNVDPHGSLESPDESKKAEKRLSIEKNKDVGYGHSIDNKELVDNKQPIGHKESVDTKNSVTKNSIENKEPIDKRKSIDPIEESKTTEKLETKHEQSVEAKNSEQRKNGDMLVKPPARPMMPPNYRKHSLMSVLSIDSAMDSKSFASSSYNPHNIHSALSSGAKTSKELPSGIKASIDNFLDVLAVLLYEELDIVNFDVLLYILEFLANLSNPRNFEKTKMNSFNLSKVFQTSFSLNNQLNNVSGLQLPGQAQSINIDILNNSLKQTISNTTASTANNNSNRLSVSVNTNNTYSGANAISNPNVNRLAPTYTRGSIISTNSGFSGVSSKMYGTNDNGTASSVNFNQNNTLSVPHNNFSLESFNSINVDYNINQLVLKILIDNFDLMLIKLYRIDSTKPAPKLFKSLNQEGQHESDGVALTSVPHAMFTSGKEEPNSNDTPSVSANGNGSGAETSKSSEGTPDKPLAQQVADASDTDATANVATDPESDAKKNDVHVKKHKLQAIFSFLHKSKFKDKKNKKEKIRGAELSKEGTDDKNLIRVSQPNESNQNEADIGNEPVYKVPTGTVIPVIKEPSTGASSTDQLNNVGPKPEPSTSPLNPNTPVDNAAISSNESAEPSIEETSQPVIPAVSAEKTTIDAPTAQPTDAPPEPPLNSIQQQIQQANEQLPGSQIVSQQAVYNMPLNNYSKGQLAKIDEGLVPGSAQMRSPTGQGTIASVSTINGDNYRPSSAGPGSSSYAVHHSQTGASTSTVGSEDTSRKLRRRQSAISLLFFKHNNNKKEASSSSAKSPESQLSLIGGSSSNVASRSGSKASLNKLSSEDLPQKQRFSTFFRKNRPGVVTQ